MAATATGRCLCGSVRYRVQGELRPVINCHCHRCRRHTGHFMAATQSRTDHLEFDSSEHLRWYSPDDQVSYGFCKECGSTLFWRCDARPELISIAAGPLDGPTGLTTTVAIWVAEANDYHTLDATLPSHQYDSVESRD